LEFVMEYRGRVKGGVIVLEEGAVLAEGVEVRIRAVTEATGPTNGDNGETLGQKLMKFSGKATGLPPDAARNHDHYLYGSAKRPTPPA
jgi:hypothetical protein